MKIPKAHLIGTCCTLNTHSEKLQKKINKARQAEEEDVTDADPLEEHDDSPWVMGETTAALNNVIDLHQNDETGPTLDELVSSLNLTSLGQVKSHLEHQAMHERARATS